MKRSVGNTFLRAQVNTERKRLLLSVTFGSLACIAMLFQWLSFAKLAEAVIVYEVNVNEQLILLCVLLISLLIKPLLQQAQSKFAHQASVNIRNSIRQKMLTTWQQTSPLALKEVSSGAYASQFVEGIESLDGYITRYWPQQALAVISPLLILAVVFYLNWLCGLLLLISAPLIPTFMILVGMGAEKLNQKYALQRQRLAGHFLDRVSALSTIKLLNAQDEILTEVHEVSECYRRVIMRTLRVAFLSSTVLEFFTSVAIAALAIYIGFSLYGAITWGPGASLTLFSGLAILILAPEFFQPLRILSQYYHDRATALGAAHHLVTMLSGQDSNATSKLRKNPMPVNVNIARPTTLVLQDLSIGYGDKSVCDSSLNLTLRTTQMLVVYGQSGTGKTTFLNTLSGFIAPITGGFAIDSEGISGSSGIAYLPQSAWIKNATVRENLQALAPNASTHEMLEVLEQLGLSDELDIKHKGLSSIIGEHSAGLSGGQLQRIAFARVLLNPSSVILLDEPTAKLDLHNKAFVLKAIRRLRAHSILVIATHDPDLIEIADVRMKLSEHGVSYS